jgi:hypothetical protein
VPLCQDQFIKLPGGGPSGGYLMTPIWKPSKI